MEYYAGMFDAEGCVSLTPGGSIKIRLNNTRELVPNLFKERFGGIVYKETTRKHKPIYSWYLSAEGIQEFCSQLIPHCLVKTRQLKILIDYKNSSRIRRREIRPETVHAIASLKKPAQVDREFFCRPSTIAPEESFFRWFAGFIEGDGSIRLYEQSSSPNVFTTCIGASNTFAEPIQHIYQRVNGSITLCKSIPHNMWKWVCSEKCVRSTLESLMPHLRAMNKQAQLILDFLQVKSTKHPHDQYTHDQINRIRDIVTQVKHLNSL